MHFIKLINIINKQSNLIRLGIFATIIQIKKKYLKIIKNNIPSEELKLKGF